MSLYHFNDWRHDLEHNVRPTHLINQQFGHGISPDDLLMPVLAPFFPHVQSHPQLPQISQIARTNSSVSLQPSTTSSQQDEHSLQRMIHHPTYADLRHYYRPWHLARKDHGSMMRHHADNFVVSLDVQQFSPEEITVKVIDKDNAIVVEGKHEEREDEHGFISRQFTRKYIIPEGHDIGKVQSHLSSDGVLTVSAPKIGEEEEKTDERVIPIVHTGPHKPIAEPAKK